MPEISRFFGIVIMMYYDEHAPPHFHARYGGQKASFTIETLEMIAGRVPARVRGLVTEWASIHTAELLEDWELARSRVPLKKIDPLS